MEQLRMNTGKDNERVVQILTDLMKTNKEFQIMITVPASGASSASDFMPREEETADQPAVTHNLEKDVTDMIHESSIPLPKSSTPQSPRNTRQHPAAWNAPSDMPLRLHGAEEKWKLWTLCSATQSTQVRENPPIPSLLPSLQTK